MGRERGIAATLFDFPRGRQALHSVTQPARVGLLAAGALVMSVQALP